VTSAFDRIHREAGRVDVLVSNAGYGVGGFVEDTTVEEFREQFETNFFGGVRVVKAVLPGMRERRSGRIILMSSIGAFNPVPSLSAYNATKAALEAFGQALRLDRPRRRVRDPDRTGHLRHRHLLRQRPVCVRDAGPRLAAPRG
jgi:NAD(P)-dependent dehydrogenase (short-subunit alcohol dehydrogenase family)